MEGTAEVVDRTNRITGSLDNLGTQAQAASKQADSLRTALASIATLATAVAVIKMADAVTTLRTQLNLSTGSAQQAAQAYDSLFQIAQKSRVSFTELGTTYAAVARAGNEMGVSQTRLLAFTQSISQAMTIGGGSAASMQAALVQLGQGLSSGTLRGEELNSIMEQTPRLAKAIADGLGVPIGELRKLGETGQLTAQQVISALEKSGPQLAKEMASATLTVGQAMTLLGNSATKMVGEMDAASGTSASLAGAIKSLSGAMDSVGETINKHQTAFAVITAGLAGAATIAGVTALGYAFVAATPAVVAFAAAFMATPFGPIALALAAVTAGVMGLKAAADAAAKSETGLGYALANLDERIAKLDASQESTWASGKKRLEGMRAERARLAAELALLSNKGLDTRAEDARLGATTATFKEKEKVAKDYQALKQELSGVNKDFQTHLSQLQAMRETGLIDEKQYVADVTALIAKEGGARKAAHKETGNPYADQQSAMKEWEKALLQADTALSKATAKTDGLSESERQLRDYMASSATTIAEKLVPGTTALVKARWDAAIAAEKDNAAAKVQSDYMESIGKAVATEVKRLEEKVAKQIEHNAAIGKTQEQIQAYMQSVEEAATVELEKQADAIALMLEKESALVDYADTQYTVSEAAKPIYELELKSLREQITLRKQLAKGYADGALKEAGVAVEKEITAERKKGWEETDRLAREVFTNQEISAQRVGDVLKKALKSAIYEATLKPLVFQIYSSATGGSSAGAIGSVASSPLTQSAGSYGASASTYIGSAFAGTAYGSGATLAGAGMGAEAFSAGVTMMSEATGFSSFMAGAGQALGAVPVIGQVALGLAVLNALMGDKFVSASDSGRARIDYNAAGVGGNAYRLTGDVGQQKTAIDAVTAIEKAYQEAAKSFGIKTIAGTFEAGYNTGAGGAHPNTIIGANYGNGSYSSGEVSSADTAAVQLAASRAVFTALQSSELPSYLKTVFNGITASTATQEKIDNTLAYASSLKTVRDALLETREPTQILKDTVAEGFTSLKTSADTFKTDFVAAIDAGVSPENFAKWNSLKTAMDNLANAAGSASPLVQNLSSALAGAQQDLADANRSAYDLLAQAQTDAAGADSYGGSSGGGGSSDNGLADAIQYLADTKTGISQWLDKLNTSDAGGLGAFQQRDNAWAAFQSQMTLAQGGDRTALDGITGYADTYISAIKSTSKTALEEQLAIAKTRAQVGNLPNSLRPEQFIVQALTGSSGGGGGSVVGAIQALNSKLVAQLNVQARSEIVKLITFISDTDKLPNDLKELALASSDLMTKTVSFITGSKLSDDNKALALQTNSALTKTVNYALGLDIPDEYKKIALKASDSIEKTISFTARNMLDGDQATLALMTDATIIKTIEAAAGHMDKSAMLIAHAQSETVRKMIEASGGVLTADQATLLDNVTAYNKQINLQISLDPGALTAAQAYMQAAFGTINVQTIMSGQTATATAPAIQAQTPAQLLKGFIDDQLKFAQTAGEGAAVANVYGAAKSYGFTQADIATVSGYSTAEVNALFDRYSIPRFAVGTDYVPNDTLAMVHKGEQIVPAAYNPHANGNAQSNAGIERRLEQLQADARVAQATMAALMSRLVKLNERWEGDGMPPPRKI